MNLTTRKLLSIEEKARKYFEQFPFLQAILAGIGVIVFWRGIWEGLDQTGVSPFASIILGIIILGAVGVFVQTFSAHSILFQEVYTEDLEERKIMKELAKEENTESISLAEISIKLDQIMKRMEENK